jgi:hypothetical protein
MGGHTKLDPNKTQFLLGFLWLTAWLGAMLVGKYWLAALIVLVGGPLLAYLLDWLLTNQRAA